MIVIRATNVNDAFRQGSKLIQEVGVPRSSRNGEVLVFPEPVTTVYARPEQRVLFDKNRKANPFFHFFESLWMLAGRDDVEFVSRFVPSMKDFSDDGETFNGAYGERWRNHFGRGTDQLVKVTELLRKNPDDRRVILQMWDGSTDLASSSKDVPCNLSVHFQVMNGKLDMTVFNRSNDMVWGAYGANAVHMSFLHEYVATFSGQPLGIYRQVSDNLHVYESTGDKLYKGELDVQNEYEHYHFKHFPIMDVKKAAGEIRRKNTEVVELKPDDYRWAELYWLAELNHFLEDPTGSSLEGKYRLPFFTQVAKPLYLSFSALKNNKERDSAWRYEEAQQYACAVRAKDWSTAAVKYVGTVREQAEDAFGELKDA